MVGYVGSWKKKDAVVGNDFWRMNFQSRKLLLLYDFNRYIPALYGQPFFFWLKLQRFPYMGGVPFLGTWCTFYHCFDFQSFVQSKFSGQHVALSGDFVPLNWLSQTRFVAMMIPVNKFPIQSVAKKRELVPLELFPLTCTFTLLFSF